MFRQENYVEEGIDNALKLINRRFERVRDYPFILITSPLGRAGTTAIYRVFRNNSRYVAYGEDYHPFNVVPVFLSQIITSLKNPQFQRKTFQNDSIKYDKWEVLSLPPQDYLVKNSLEAAYTYMATYIAECDNNQKVVMKKPSLQMKNVFAFKRLLPKTKLIYMHRDIREILPSAESYYRRMPMDSDMINAQIDRWITQSKIFCENANDEIILNYRKISPQYVKMKFEQHDISLLRDDYSILEKKINNFGKYKNSKLLSEQAEICIRHRENEIDQLNDTFQKF